MVPLNEAFSRVLIDKALEYSGWNLQALFLKPDWTQTYLKFFELE